MTRSIASLSGVDVWLGDNHVLHQTTMNVNPGEVVALLGGNGSGKTTLLRALLGLTAHQTGTIHLFGQPVERFRAWSQVGYVPQRSHLQVPNATVQEIVAMGRLAERRLFRPLGRRDREAIDEAMERVGLANHHRQSMNRLSGGQQQRALIARALAAQADFLVLDEPLTALDLRTQTSLVHLLARLHDEGLTILVVLHELGTMEPLLTRSVVLQAGWIIYDGQLLSEIPTEAGGCPGYRHRPRSMHPAVRRPEAHVEEI